MPPKSLGSKPPTKAAQELSPWPFIGEAHLTLDIRPAELAAIAACLCSRKGKGKLSDYFEEAMKAVRDAAQFLTESKPKVNDIEVKSGPHGHLEIATVVPSHVITRPLPAEGLTFSKLLAPTGEIDRRGKPTAWFGAITTERYLRVFINKAGRNQILTKPEVDEILERKTMRPEQYVKLLTFQTASHRNRGKAVAAAREKKAVKEETPRTPSKQ